MICQDKREQKVQKGYTSVIEQIYIDKAAMCNQVSDSKSMEKSLNKGEGTMMSVMRRLFLLYKI